MNIFVNARQTKKERREKYKKLKDAGFKTWMCKRARDWTNNHIDQLIEANIR